MSQPILGEKIHGPIGRTIDIVAIVGTVFGVAVSIGLGTLQINGGLSQLTGIPESAGWNLIIIGVVCGLATISVALGMDRASKSSPPSTSGRQWGCWCSSCLQDPRFTR